MASAARADGEETQVLNLDSPAPVEVTILYGETQALDGSDSSDGEGVGAIDERQKTQLMDIYEETAAVDSGDEGTDRTEVLIGDDEELSDDGATHCGDKENGAGVESGAGVVANGGDNLRLAREKKVDLVDSDASTDDGGDDDDNGDAGPGRRSFAAVRAAAMRSSGLAAARHFASMRLEDGSISFNNGKHNGKEDSAAHGQLGLAGIGVNKWTNSGKDLTSLNTDVGKLDLDHEITSFQKSSRNYRQEGAKSRCCNIRVKRLFNDLLPSEKDGSISKDENIVSKVGSPYLHTTDDVVAGLSYIGSQEPSDLSQANALDIVDKFLSINDVGSSQEMKDAETDVLKSPLVSGAKGVQLLAEKTDCRSPVGKPGIFDWNDSLEDEGGGEFFSKRKDSFFEGTCGSRKTKSHPPKSRYAVDKSQEEGANSKNCDEGTALVHSDSRLMMPNPKGKERVHISETTINKNLFKDKGKLNLEFLEDQLAVTDVNGGSDGIYDVGPDTQMAAEAMEALVNGSLLNVENKETGHLAAGNLSWSSCKSLIMNTASSKHGSLQKRTSVNDSELIMTRSKSRKILSTRPGTGSPNIPRVCSTGSRVKSSLEDRTVRRQAKRGKANFDGCADARSIVSGHDSFKSKKEKRQVMVDRHLDEQQKQHNDLLEEEGRTVRRQAKRGKGKFDERADARCIVSGHDSSKSKKAKIQAMVDRHLDEQQKQHNDILEERNLAQRTRYSKRVKLLKQNEALPNDGKDPNESMDANSTRDIDTVDDLVADASGSMEAIGICLTTEVKKYAATQSKLLNHAPPVEEPQASFLTIDDSYCPKRRRTSWVTLDSSSGGLNKPSFVGPSETIERCSKQRGKKRIFIRSVSDILDKVKRRKRSITHMSLQVDRDPSSSAMVRMICGVKTRTSLRSSSEKDTAELARTFLPQPVTPTCASILSASLLNHSLHTEKAQPLPNLCSEFVEDAEENDKSPKAKCQPNNLACKTPSKDINAISPVCIAKNSPRSCNKLVSTSSVARELRRLESNEASTPMLKDMRRRKDMASVRVLFSHHLAEDIIKQQKKILARLGLPTASSISDATHFVTNKFVRTQNMLESIAAGKPVVTPMWLESCGLAGCFMDEKKYIVRDYNKEREIGFNMPVSLARASQHPLLQGKRVFITPNVKPSRELIASLVKASHGQAIKRIGRSAMKQDKVPVDLLIISCEEDYSICIPFLEKGAEVFSSELLLNGIVIQKLEYGRHRLFSDHVKQTRSTIWFRHNDRDQFLPVTKCT